MEHRLGPDAEAKLKGDAPDKAKESPDGDESAYKMLFSVITEAILVVDTVTRYFTYVNPAACDMFGYDEGEFLQLRVEDLHPEEELPGVRDEFQAMVAGKTDRAYDIPCLHKNGSVFYNDIRMAHFVIGAVKFNVGFFTDSSSRRQAVEALRKNEELLRLITDNMSDMIRVVDLRGVNLYLSPSHFKKLGYKPENRLNRSAFEIIHRDDADRCKKVFSDALAFGRQAVVQYRVRHADGGYIWLETVGDAMRDATGRITAAILSSRDVTDRKKMEEELISSEQRYRGIIKGLQEAYYEGDLDGNFVFVNDALCRSLGYEPEEVIGKSHRLFQDRQWADQLYRDFHQVFTTGLPRQGIETQFIKKDGNIVCYELSSLVRRDAYGKAVGSAGVAIDITARKKAEEALRLSEENFRRSLDDSPLGARIVSAGGDTIYANKTLLDIYGYDSIDELRSKSVKERYTPESYLGFLERREKRKAGQYVPPQYEISICRKDGQIRHLQAFRKEILWNGQTQFQILYNDITNHKNAEIEKQILKERLNRAEKMEVLGRMAGGVAHDLNNVLGALTGYQELLMMEIPAGDRARGNVEKMMKSTGRMAAIVQDLLTLARRGVTTTEVLNLNSVVSSLLKSPVWEKLKEGHPQVNFSVKCHPELLDIRGSVIHLEKTLINLATNAAEAITGAGEVTIKTRNRYLDRPVGGYDDIKEGDYVILTVSDTGKGIPKESQEKIFEPFYTSKTMGRSGTGLGLAIVWGTVKDHGGYIDVTSKEGEGSIFTLYFPVTREEKVALSEEEIKYEYRGNGESVLIVDDVEEQRNVASAILTRLGYQVHSVSGGEEAVEYLRGNKVDIILLDMIMTPGIDGLETYRRILRVNPRQKVIIVSGYAETQRVREAQRLGAGRYIRKPYMIKDIGIAIREELGR